MTTRNVLFIQGGGQAAHEADAELAEAIQKALGTGYALHFPHMPLESDPDLQSWGSAISSALVRIVEPAIVIGHSVGGSILLKRFAEQRIERRITGLFLLAAPAWDGDRWAFDDLRLPADASHRMGGVPLFLYHCRDDEVVPFAHLALHGAQFPRATCRPIEDGGHQFASAIDAPAADIRDLCSR